MPLGRNLKRHPGITTMIMIGALTLSLLLLGGQQARSQPAAVAPEFFAGKGDWIQKPVTLTSLKGKVVLVDFWAYTCVNCIRTFPYLNEWYRRYHNKGFEIVAVQTPEFAIEADPKNVLAATKRFGFKFPVLNDPKSKNWQRYGVDAWPTKFLIDGSGHIIGGDVGEGRYDEMELSIQTALEKLHPRLKLGSLMKPVRPTDARGAVCRPCTLETYAGLRGIEEHAVPYSKDRIGKTTHMEIPAKQVMGMYFAGDWTPQNSYVQSDGPGRIAYKYMAKDVNAVLQTAGSPVQVEVWQDGKPIDKAAIGDDVRMVGGVPVMTVSEPRMYSVLRNQEWGMHDLQLYVRNSGLRLYTFTFGTDCRPLPRTKGGKH